MFTSLWRILANERGWWVVVKAGRDNPRELAARFPPYTLIGWGRQWGGYWGQP